MKKLTISAIGEDQPGIVAAFTKVLFESGCNIEDTSMTILEDQFAMLFIVNVPKNLSTAELEERLKSVLQDFNLKLSIHTLDISRETVNAEGQPWMISVSGKDQTGIMCHVTQYLAAQKINIRHLSSKRLTRTTGETLFLMALEVDVPGVLSDIELRDDLATVAQQEQLEIHAEPLETYTL